MLLTVSCDSILEVDVPDNLVHHEFWQNRDQVYSSLIGLYTSLHNNLDSYHAWGDLRSSFYAPGIGDAFTGAHAQFLSHDIYQNNDLLSWKFVYRSITWINSFIKNAPTALEHDNTFSAAELQSMVGEARALRALNYFYLVRAFREVPVIDEPYESDNQQFDTSPSSEEEVLDFIEADLQQALGDAPASFDNVANRYGRVTKNMVRALWADVKLWRNDYQGCIDLCDQLEAQYAGSLVSPLAWYTIFNPGNSAESIFEFQYGQLGPASPLYNWFAIFSRANSDGERYLANATNVSINAQEILYPPVLPDYATSDTIRLSSFAMFNPIGISNGYGVALEVYKFLGTAPYQVSYRPANARNTNYIFYRYREVLFMKAEAYAMLNRYAEAEQLINIIREHCDIPPLAQGEGGEGTEFISRLLMEREYELGFEGKEWFAAVRIARRPGYEGILQEKAAINNSMGRSYQVIRARLLDQESWFLPYHLTEVENNPQLDQKPYYRNK
ncbi:RagB/SusD family nutrient uptake outer membrane protein [Parapedobacter tibetensis]|uniref:RagB/SusD family nutrient uptake outer membrane protein n=1 Tax=Parapedobacter tibetensis TaxID=2972951 RepID=UPI00214D9184|nr:RagB/SusD family nutrient uptake outer membrane protein [Parapedobacter tibetensis]